ncbi:MFS transporter, partial [Streptomyces sp. W16]|nr:MFS transporter [Streptomyces sp. W16]
GSFLSVVLGPSIVASIGIGLCFVPLGTAATTGVAAEETGMASGLLNSSRQIGGALGLAVLATVATHASGPGTAGLVDGFTAAYRVAALLLFGAAVLAAVLHGKSTRPAKTGRRKKSWGNSGACVDPAALRSTHG